jgi:hypothetical protein
MLDRRRNKNFFTKLQISNTAFVVAQRAKWDFNSVGLALLVESNDSNDVVQYSFNGKDVHGDLTPLLPSEGIVFDNRFENNVWFRRVTPGDPVTVRIEAWQYDA